MAPAGPGPFCASESRAVFAGGRDLVRVLRVDCSHRKEESGDEGEGDQRLAHQSRSLGTMLTVYIGLAEMLYATAFFASD
jgi:hypothetical protein